MAEHQEFMAEITRVQTQSEDPALEEARNQLARMIALHGHDPSLVEDDIFQSFVASLNPRFKVPSRSDIEEMCDCIFTDARRGFFDRNFQSLLNRPISIAVGKAKTMEKQVLCVSLHFIDDEWNLHRYIRDVLVESDNPCAGPILGVRVLRTQVGRIVYGYAGPTMLHMVATDENLQPEVKKHVEAVVGKKIWFEYESRERMADRRDTHCTIFVDCVLHSIARCLVPGFSLAGILSEDLEMLHLTRQHRQRLLSHLAPDYQWAYDEQWYLCYYALQLLHTEGSPRSWNPFSELMCKLLGQVYHAIQAVSASGCPTSNLYLAELFKLRDVLQSELDRADIDGKSVASVEVEFDKDVASALRAALETLDKAIQDSYLVWSVPLVLDPRYKLRYIEFSFQRAYGSSKAQKYVSEVMATMIKKLYNNDDSDTGTDIVVAASDCPLEQAWNDYCRSSSQDAMAIGVKTELDRYLEDRLSPQTHNFDLLGWWKVHSSEYPKVAQMARDALAMPTSSKLSSEQMAQVRSIIRGYSKQAYRGRDDY